MYSAPFYYRKGKQPSLNQRINTKLLTMKKNEIMNKTITNVVIGLNKFFQSLPNSNDLRTASDLHALKRAKYPIRNRSLRNGRAAKKAADYLIRRVSCEGRPGLDKWKEISSYFTRRILGVEAVMPTCKIRGFFWVLFQLSKGDYHLRLYVLTVFQLHRLVKLKPERDVESISQPFTGSWMKFWWTSYRCLTDSSGVIRRYTSLPWDIKFRWFLSESSGPNGSRAWTRYHTDFKAVLDDYRVRIPLYGLWKSLPFSNRKPVEDLAHQLAKWYRGLGSSDQTAKGSIHSRLAFLSDKGGKTRVVALGDLWSQSILRPVHDRLFSVLEKLPTDGTFDQDKQRRRVQRMTETGNLLHSIDLSSATDRYPAKLIAWSLYRCGILNAPQAFWWLLVMTRRSFHYGRHKVRYSVGQPMGMLSSWASFALAHHHLVQAAAHRCGYKGFFEGYALLGDDIVIFNQDVAQVYLQMLDHLGVKTSSSKSVIAVGVAEFAKSFFCYGKNLKPLSLTHWTYAWDSVVSDSIALVSELRERNIRASLRLVLSIYPAKETFKITNALLSPLRDFSSYFGLPKSEFDVKGLLERYLWGDRVSIPDVRKDIKDIKTIIPQDPTHISREGFSTPHLQYARECRSALNGSSWYQSFADLFGERSYDGKVKVGSDFTAWDPDFWVIKPGNRTQRRLPNWKRSKDDRKEVGRLNRFCKLLPNSFWPSCNVKGKLW